MTAKCDYPVLKKTLKAVERAIKSSENLIVTRKDVLKALPAGTKRSTLEAALDCLEGRGWILDGRKGLVWIRSSNARLKKAITEGLEV